MDSQEQQRQKGSGDLLDNLAARLDCGYLSDLKMPQRREQIANLVSTIPAQDYTLEQWNEALAYLCRQNPCNDADSAKLALLKNCQP